MGKVPNQRGKFANKILASHNINTNDLESDQLDNYLFQKSMTSNIATLPLEVGFSQPISLITNSLGVPPKKSNGDG